MSLHKPNCIEMSTNSASSPTKLGTFGFTNDFEVIIRYQLERRYNLQNKINNISTDYKINRL